MHGQPTKSTTMPKFPSEDVKDPPYENVGVEKNELAVARELKSLYLYPLSLRVVYDRRRNLSIYSIISKYNGFQKNVCESDIRLSNWSL